MGKQIKTVKPTKETLGCPEDFQGYQRLLNALLK